MIAMSVGAASTLFMRPGFLDAVARVGSAPTDLDVALGAARWIRRSRIATKDGITWPADPANAASSTLDLYSGAAGVVLFHLELYDATHDKTWLDEARLGANDLIAKLPTLQSAEASGLYTGLGGIAFVLEETHRLTGEERYREGAKQAIGMIQALAHKTITSAEWSGHSIGPDILSGSAGIGLLLLWADAQMDDGESRAIALITGRRLLEMGVPAGGGTKWTSAQDAGRSYPNFARGTAGVSYFLAELFRVTGDRACLAAALSGARYLESIAKTAGDGFALFEYEPGGEATYASGWCDGPAGTARLFHELGIVTGRAKWRDLAHACARSIAVADVSSLNQCAGAAGAGEFLVALQREAANPAYAAAITRLSDEIRRRAIVDGDGFKWVEAKTGFMDGAAGVATFLLHADALANKRTPSISWPDSPWQRPCGQARVKTSLDMSDVNSNISRGC